MIMEWIACSDQMPDTSFDSLDGYVVVAVNADGKRLAAHWSDNRFARNPRPRWEDGNGQYRGSPITHWMRLSDLPAPPATPQSEGAP